MPLLRFLSLLSIKNWFSLHRIRDAIFGLYYLHHGITISPAEVNHVKKIGERNQDAIFGLYYFLHGINISPAEVNHVKNFGDGNQDATLGLYYFLY